MSLSRGYQKRPYPYKTEEWESFKNYAMQHYKDAIEIAYLVAQDVKRSLDPTILTNPDYLFLKILDKTASPLVFIWEQWQLTSLKERLPYATENYKKQLKQRIRS